MRMQKKEFDKLKGLYRAETKNPQRKMAEKSEECVYQMACQCIT